MVLYFDVLCISKTDCLCVRSTYVHRCIYPPHSIVYYNGTVCMLFVVYLLTLLTDLLDGSRGHKTDGSNPNHTENTVGEKKQ